MALHINNLIMFTPY